MKHAKLSEDTIDALLSDYFKTEMPKPWPAAPVVEFAQPQLLNAAPTLHSVGATVATDTNARARYTLAASIALLLGSCWVLSNGFDSGPRATRVNVPSVGTVDMNSTGAADPAVGKELRKTGAENGPMGGFDPNAIDPFK